jgi:Xaa-Pro aminopeptidase
MLVDYKTDLYYLTGMELSAGFLLAHAKGANLFVDSRYFELCKKNSPFPVELSDAQSIATILLKPEFSFIHKLGFDCETTSFKVHDKIAKSLNSTKELNVELVPLDGPIKWLRMIKDDSEVITLRDAAHLGSQGFDFLCSILKEGITEKECAIELEIFWKKRGSKNVAFDPIIAFGAHSSMPHYRAGNAPLMRGQIVLLDIGVNLKHYHSDMTRIAFFGQPDPRLLAIHAIVQKAQQAALALCRPGTTISALDNAAREIIASHGHAAHFTHSLGHGVGLDIHEYPTLKKTPPFENMPLVPGMVITIEPGIYLPDIGGVRIEDTVVITKDGHENLTKRNTDPVLL